MAEEARAAVRRDWPEPLELQRRDLLTARRRRLRRTLQCRVPLQRLLVVARLREEVEAEEVAGYHRKLFEDASEYYIREQVSGLLLLSSSRVLHVVESCSSTMHFLIRALASLQNQGPSALLQEIKVLVVAHNIPSRLFLRWDVAVVTSPVTRPEDSMQSQSIEEVVAECLTLLINVADYVLKSAEKLCGPFPCTYLPDAACSRRFFLQQDSHVSHKSTHKDAWLPLQAMSQGELRSSSLAAAEHRDNCTAVGVELLSHGLQKWPH
uniref:SPOC domain-containing protein n=1 Tax=Pavo cristatus TaxID=9049 RepID=A0A8C9L877_PAVCR